MSFRREFSKNEEWEHLPAKNNIWFEKVEVVKMLEVD